ncbi:MAG: RDD family protein [Burkholderiaceae bacterium]
MITITTPSLKHRLASMLYEAMLLFGVLFISAWLFSTLLQQRNALYLRHALQYWLFLVVGVYFVWFWTHSGQTLAMKTWRIRLVTKNGEPVKIGRAIARYVLAWLWFAPGLALAAFLGAKTWLLIWIPAANMFLWAAAIYIDPNRQFLHDRFAGTRLTTVTIK